MGGYLGKARPELRMPRPESWPAGCGFRSDGPVMNGLISVEEAHRRSNAAAFIELAGRNGSGRAHAAPRVVCVDR